MREGGWRKNNKKTFQNLQYSATVGEKSEKLKDKRKQPQGGNLEEKSDTDQKMTQIWKEENRSQKDMEEKCWRKKDIASYWGLKKKT